MDNENPNRDLILQAGLQAIPYLGSSLSTLYFGAKQEKRFERLETFYRKIKEEIESREGTAWNITEHNQEDLINLIEQINEKVEVETREKKLCYLKNFFVNTLQKPIKNDFDERKYFLDILASMSLLECKLLAELFKLQNKCQIKQINKPEIDQYAILGAINKLRSYGFLESRRGSYQFNGQQDENLDDMVFISSFGAKFCNYVKILQSSY